MRHKYSTAIVATCALFVVARPPLILAAPEVVKDFKAFDKDGNGELSLDELLTNATKDGVPEVTRDYGLVDWDGSKTLSPAEFKCLPQITGRSQRGAVPDPLAVLARKQIQEVSNGWSTWDSEKDGSLTSEEFSAAAFSSKIPGLEVTDYSDWDLDSDKKLTQSEVERAIEAAYGIMHLNGASMRRQNGVVFNLDHFTWLDRDADNLVKAEDLQVREKIDLTAASRKIQDLDIDGDGALTRSEAWNVSQIDVFEDFCAADTNLDGALTEAELIKAVPEYDREMASFMIPAFDDDKSGSLDFLEYRLTPFATGDELWRKSKVDEDKDGLLSWDEYTQGRRFDSVAVMATIFDKLDISDDGFLDQTEFYYSTTVRNVERDFEVADKNSDGELTVEELLVTIRPDQKPVVRRDHRLVDWDGSKTLSIAEFNCLPQVSNRSQRGVVPDPLADLAKGWVEQIAQGWQQWDSSKDGSLASDEFSRAGFHSKIPGLKSTKFSDWDLNDDKNITQEEATRAVNAAFGVTRIDGTALRRPNGVVFNLTSFWWMDVNNDGGLAAMELEKVRKWKVEAANEKIKELDSDSDNVLSMSEAWEMNHIDVLGAFRATDTDLNGELSAKELVERATSHDKDMASFMLAAFDDDENGSLDFKEYRLTPFATADELWRDRRVDKDKDGLLSWDEYTRGRRFDSVAVMATIFDKLDISDDGFLDQTEFYYSTTVRNVERDFEVADKNSDGELTAEELLSTIRPDQKPVVRRDHRLVDWDGSKTLSIAEFNCLPQVSNRSQRGVVPDPLADLAKGWVEQIAQGWQQWDSSKDGGLASDEFSRAGFHSKIPGLKSTKFSDWDLNDDKNITQEEATRAVNAAFGVTRIDGTALRRPNGVVFNLTSFWWMDVNNDGGLAAMELEKVRKWKVEAANEKIKELDSDSDNVLSMSEAWEMNHIDVLGAFRATDTDLNGELSAKELIERAYNQDKDMASFMLPAFDEDKSGSLDFKEYRLTPFATADELWRERRIDKDKDGLLSWDEYTQGRRFDSVAVMATIFDKLDISDDGFLDQTEFYYSTTVRNVERDFEVADKNSDGELTLDEFDANDKDSPRQKRDFKVFDFDASRTLSYSEFRMVPDRVSRKKRIALDDPLLAMAQGVTRQATEKFNAADKGGDSALDNREFRDSGINRAVPGLQLKGFSDWDLNQDRKVSLQECVAVVSASYGIMRFDGVPLRMPSGMNCNVVTFVWADKDKNNKLTSAEYLDRADRGSAAHQNFNTGDTDSDGILSFSEWTLGVHWQVDPLTDYLRYDSDFSGLVTAVELRKLAPEWQAAVIAHYLPAFDTDGDSKLSLQEYRLVPTANPIAPWNRTNADRDHDGRLSFLEFYPEKGIFGVSLAQFYFERFDTNGNGHLEIGEWHFTVNVSKAPVDAVFEYCNLNNDAGLTLDELLVDLKSRKNKGAAREIRVLEDLFLDSDSDSDGKLTRAELEDGRRQNSGRDVNRLSTAVSRKNAPKEGRLWILVIFNTLLVVGVAWFVMFRK